MTRLVSLNVGKNISSAPLLPVGIPYCDQRSIRVSKRECPVIAGWLEVLSSVSSLRLAGEQCQERGGALAAIHLRTTRSTTPTLIAIMVMIHPYLTAAATTAIRGSQSIAIRSPSPPLRLMLIRKPDPTCGLHALWVARHALSRAKCAEPARVAK